jgi:hypothetical protein
MVGLRALRRERRGAQIFHADRAPKFATPPLHDFVTAMPASVLANVAAA